MSGSRFRRQHRTVCRSASPRTNVRDAPGFHQNFVQELEEEIARRVGALRSLRWRCSAEGSETDIRLGLSATGG